MARIGVLVVDDSVVVRRLLTESLEADPELEVVASAANGKIALDRLERAKPDVVILDVEMPVMDGLETLSAIRAVNRRIPVIMFSTLTERGAATTLEALSRGATDYVTKPSNVAGVQEAKQRLRSELIPRIKQLCGVTAAIPGVSPHQPRPAKVAPPRPVRRVQSRVDLLVIGVSTGGPVALEQLFTRLPGDLPVPVVVVQHMPPVFTRMLAERLDRCSALHVAEASDGVVAERGQAWIAPGDHHLVLARSESGAVLRTTTDPPENFCRPAVDVLFRSAAGTYGPGVLGLVMTGMGQDGLRGSELIVQAGGAVLAQDQPSSVVWGMPGSVAQAGLADEVLPLDQLAPAVVRRVRDRHGAPSPSLADGPTLLTGRRVPWKA